MPKYLPFAFASKLRAIKGLGVAEGEVEEVTVVLEAIVVVEVGLAVVVVVDVELLYQLEKDPLVVAAESAAATL